MVVIYLLHVDLEWSGGLALRAGSGLHFLVLRLDERSENVAALVAVILDDGQLWKDAGRARHDAARSDQLIQMQLPVETRYF